ncbi:MAG: DNA recombination protein RmuC [Alistipes sp.]
MNIALIILLLLLVLLCVVLAAYTLSLRRDTARLQAEKAVADAELRTLSEARTAAQVAEAEARTKLNAIESRMATEKAEREKSDELMRAQFKNIASDIFGEQSRNFRETNKEALDVLLKPFKENITSFRERVEKIYSTESEQHGALRNELENLMTLNRKITTETANLTSALKGNSKVQGDWGEMILETILDSSNLVKGIQYTTQQNLKDAEGNNLRPDVIIRLPEEKQIVVDSKVSLTAFVGYTAAESEVERAQYLAAHVASVRQHVTELGRKEYQRLLDSPDFVIMFIPNEPAFLAALQSDATIWNDAYDKKVIISSPTNLFALLKLVDDLWKRNAQNKNTSEIVTYGTKLYEQLVAFTASLDNVGTSLDKARDAYTDAYKRLCTGNDNIIRSGERLRKLGLPTKKQHSAKTIELTEHLDEE